MWFHLFTGNHDEQGAITICDTMEWLAAGLTELKHEVTVGDTIAPHAVNIIWENFYNADVRIFDEQRFKFGLIATELPTGRTFNWLDHDPWLTRRNCFDRIAPRAQFIWSMMEQPIEFYQQWALSGFLELGFSEKILDPVFSQEPEFDFGFYGLSITPYRRKVLDELKAHCAITSPDRLLKGRELNKFIASFKVGLCLKHMPDWPVSSPARLSRLLHAKRGVAAEYVPVQTGPSAFVTMAEKDQDFASFCLECVRGPWKQRAEEAYERFRAAMPMKTIMERLLDETLSLSMLSMGTSVGAGSIIGAPAVADDGLRVSLPFQKTDTRPRLLEKRKGFNFVHYKDRIYALHEKTGPIDVAAHAENLLARFGQGAVIITDSIEEARAQLDARASVTGDTTQTRPADRD